MIFKLLCFLPEDLIATIALHSSGFWLLYLYNHRAICTRTQLQLIMALWTYQGGKISGGCRRALSMQVSPLLFSKLYKSIISCWKSENCHQVWQFSSSTLGEGVLLTACSGQGIQMECYRSSKNSNTTLRPHQVTEQTILFHLSSFPLPLLMLQNVFSCSPVVAIPSQRVSYWREVTQLFHATSWVFPVTRLFLHFQP